MFLSEPPAECGRTGIRPLGRDWRRKALSYRVSGPSASQLRTMGLSGTTHGEGPTSELLGPPGPSRRSPTNYSRLPDRPSMRTARWVKPQPTASVLTSDSVPSSTYSRALLHRRAEFSPVGGGHLRPLVPHGPVLYRPVVRSRRPATPRSRRNRPRHAIGLDGPVSSPLRSTVLPVGSTGGPRRN